MKHTVYQSRHFVFTAFLVLVVANLFGQTKSTHHKRTTTTTANSTPNLIQTANWIASKINSYGLPYDTYSDVSPLEETYVNQTWCVDYRLKYSSVQPNFTVYSDGFIFIDKYSTGHLRSILDIGTPQDELEGKRSEATWVTDNYYSSDSYTIYYNTIDKITFDYADRSMTIYTKGNDIVFAGNPLKKDRIYIKINLLGEYNLPQRLQSAFNNLKTMTAVNEAY